MTGILGIRISAETREEVEWILHSNEPCGHCTTCTADNYCWLHEGYGLFDIRLMDIEDT